MNVPKFKTKYCGLRLESTKQKTSRATGRREWWLSFYCKGGGVRRRCGKLFETTLSVANQSHAKQRPLRCPDCQQAARVERAKNRPSRQPERETRTYSGGYLPTIPRAAIDLLKRYEKKPYYKQIVQITARQATAMVKQGIVPEWVSIVADAVMLAEMEAAGAQFPADWTPETRGQGLKIQSYDLSAHAPPL